LTIVNITQEKNEMSFKLITWKNGFVDLSVEDVEDKKELARIIKNAYEVKFADFKHDKNNNAYTHTCFPGTDMQEYVMVLEE
jgi:hypothetical protein